jgi:LPXTG-motif cell wall-anchored protein
VPFSFELRRVLFRWAGTRRTQRNALRAHYALLLRVGIPKSGFHRLRHTFASSDGSSVAVAVAALIARDGTASLPSLRHRRHLEGQRETLVVCSPHGFDSPIPSVSTPFKTEQSEHAVLGHNQSTMDTNTLIIVLLVVLLLGGGGFYYRGRRRI